MTELHSLTENIAGQVLFDSVYKAIYATDASVYRETPLAVVIPENEQDIKQTIDFAKKHKLSIIPRGAGTSLAGQCVGNGIVLDTSKMKDIIHFDRNKRTVTVHPGIVRDELNRFLKDHHLFFSPITSTSNRATIGGMVGNNSSGTTSIKYGVTRDKVLSVKAFLQNGNEVIFGQLSSDEYLEKLKLETQEGEIYRFFHDQLSNPQTQENIKKEFPAADIHRRNTGYALDELLKMQPFTENGEAFNLAKFIAGSEGTLCVLSEITLKLDETQPPLITVVATHCDSIHNALLSTKIAMQHEPYKCELMDKIILDCTKGNKEQLANRFFVQGDPKAILMVEFRSNSPEDLEQQIERYITDINQSKLAFHNSFVHNEDCAKVWKLRSAGLGLLANIPSEKKAVACVEDTAVSVDILPEFISEFTELMEAYNQEAVYYAHAGAGEIHLRPMLNLKIEEDRELFYKITRDTALLVKKFKGSLSGEHGDGRVRAPFIPLMVGDENYQMFIEIKKLFDPQNIFNPGKIVHAKDITEDLRTDYSSSKDLKTIYNFLPEGGFLSAVEKCNGSGDCRKSPEENGAMCPSFHATQDEKETTRARANMLREFLTDGGVVVNEKEVKSVLDLCLSCKACKSECPSGVDMAAMKAEFTHQYHMNNGIPLRTKVFGNLTRIHRLFQFSPALHNLGTCQKIFSTPLKNILGIAKKRSLPPLQKSLLKWSKNRNPHSSKTDKELYLFVDEFSNYLDTEIAKKTVLLLESLSYKVHILKHPTSARAELSKGLLARAKKIAEENILFWKDKVKKNRPLVGIEPSAILGFRDEFLRIIDPKLLAEAQKITQNTYTLEEFIASEIRNNRIDSQAFTEDVKIIHLHIHCHQKALVKTEDIVSCLSIPKGVHVEIIPSGCCGMAGSFGYEKEHYDISMKIGEQILFPAVRKSQADFISAAGTSCRHQIKDGTNRLALHPAEILYMLLKQEN